MLQSDERAFAESATAAYERIVTERPDELHAALTRASADVIRLRDALILRHRREPGEVARDLAAANAVLSLAYAAQFPIAGLHWERVERTRDALRAMLQNGGES